MSKQLDYDELLEKTIKIAREQELTIIEEIIAFLPCCKSTFYAYRMHELDELKDVINENKVKIKQKLRKLWIDEGSASERIALYKLVGTQDERDALNGKQEDSKNNEIRVVIDRGTIKSRDDIND